MNSWHLENESCYLEDHLHRYQLEHYILELSLCRLFDGVLLPRNRILGTRPSMVSFTLESIPSHTP